MEAGILILGVMGGSVNIDDFLWLTGRSAEEQSNSSGLDG